MSSQRDACRRKADEAKQRAAHATEPFMKSAYEKVAEHWMLLARLESFVGDEESNEEAQQVRTLTSEVAVSAAFRQHSSFGMKESLGRAGAFKGLGP
jgi:hypothetical protein